MKSIPRVGTKVLVEATVVRLNAGEWGWDWLSGDNDVEGPCLPVPCVEVRKGISFGVAVEELRACSETAAPGETMNTEKRG